MKDYVRTQRLRSQEMFVPLVHAPGDAQADFGEALNYPHLPLAQVRTTQATDYMTLLGGVPPEAEQA